jgi:riboflavin kinase
MKSNLTIGVYEWPDLAFHHYCLQMYRLNRGIYNTIDQWLYDNGYPEIKRRRKMIIRFLDLMTLRQAEEGRKFLSFGKGNLIVELTEFVAEQDIHARSVLSAY